MTFIRWVACTGCVTQEEKAAFVAEQHGLARSQIVVRPWRASTFQDSIRVGVGGGGGGGFVCLFYKRLF